jgi:hypothetical protein
VIDRGLDATAPLWPAIRHAFAWVHLAAGILGKEGIDAATARRRLRQLLKTMTRQQNRVGELASAVRHFVKVSRSYWPGLFHCYAVADLPRTNNALEQMFGSYRHHERRVSGRKVASPVGVGQEVVQKIGVAAGRYELPRKCVLQRKEHCTIVVTTGRFSESVPSSCCGVRDTNGR